MDGIVTYPAPSERIVPAVFMTVRRQIVKPIGGMSEEPIGDCSRSAHELCGFVKLYGYQFEA
jgi:hypothetical protein